MNFIVVEITPIGMEKLLWKFYIIWMILNLLMIPIVHFFYVETANRSLEDMDHFFRDNDNIFIFRDEKATSVKNPYANADRITETPDSSSSVDEKRLRGP